MLVGKTIGPYLVDKELGSGAMGTVYRGRHQKTGKKVAIKVILPGLTSNELAMSRFEREIAILKQLDHVNIVKLLTNGKINKSPFYVMEYVKGESLDHVIERRTRVGWDELVPIGQQLCAGLQHAHDKGIIHRDLKPSNVMILKDGTVKLTDFGIAKDTDVTGLTGTNSTVGTASYMSPELCKGTKNLTPKSDLYSMGVMFYELLTGQKPFQAESIMEMFNQHLQGTFERPSRLVLDIPIWLDTLVCQLLEKDPLKRPFNAELVSESLGKVREKVETQQSAGMDAAKKRRVDRSAVDIPLDQGDKEVARTLLGKKKKKKALVFYRKGWFTFLAVGAVLAGFALVFYLVFLKIPSPEHYLERAQALLKSPEYKERREGRETVDEFFRYYQDHAQAGAMRKMADQYDRAETERQMLNRRNAKISADGEAETLARDALDKEDTGRLDEAARAWKKLAAFESKKGSDHGWGLVAKEYLAELGKVKQITQDLQKKVGEEKAKAKKYLPESEAERLVMDAFRKDQPSQALHAWNDLKTQMKDDPDNRRWYLLAALKHRELSEKEK